MRMMWVVWACLLCMQSHAFELSPMVQEMSLSAKNMSTQILLKNTSALDVPFEIQVNEIVFYSSGEYQIKPASEDIIVLPPAVILPAGGSQVLRLQWVADKAITKSKAYYIHVSQPPIQTENNADGVRLALSVNAVVHVVPNDVHANVIVTDVAPLTPSSIAVTLLNEGNKYAHVSDFSVGVYDMEEEFIVSKDNIKRLGYDAFLAPGVSKDIEIEIPSRIDKNSMNIRLIKEK